MKMHVVLFILVVRHLHNDPFSVGRYHYGSANSFIRWIRATNDWSINLSWIILTYEKQRGWNTGCLKRIKSVMNTHSSERAYCWNTTCAEHLAQSIFTNPGDQLVSILSTSRGMKDKVNATSTWTQNSKPEELNLSIKSDVVTHCSIDGCAFISLSRLFHSFSLYMRVCVYVWVCMCAHVWIHVFIYIYLLSC